MDGSTSSALTRACAPLSSRLITITGKHLVTRHCRARQDNDFLVLDAWPPKSIEVQQQCCAYKLGRKLRQLAKMQSFAIENRVASGRTGDCSQRSQLNGQDVVATEQSWALRMKASKCQLQLRDRITGHCGRMIGQNALLSGEGTVATTC